jgi:RNA-directed DNA polymerase
MVKRDINDFVKRYFFEVEDLQLESKKVKRSLKKIFVSTFHEKLSFDEFISLDVSNEYKVLNINKRTVFSASPKLKKIHKFLNKSILEYADFSEEVVFSYRKGFSARDAVEKHANSRFIFQTDISDFYKNIQLENVKTAFTNQLSNIPVSDIDIYIEQIIKLVVVDNHIPAGFSTSPLLSNICLLDFDNALLNYCQDNGLTYTRYSDDLIISADNDVFISKLGSVIEKLLKKNVNSAVCINASKTKSHNIGHSFKILGFSILPNGVVTIPSADKNHVESMIYFFLTDQVRFEKYINDTLKNKKPKLGDKTLREYGIDSLSGKLIAFNSMDKNYVSKLRKKYGNTVVDMFIRKSVK